MRGVTCAIIERPTVDMARSVLLKTIAAIHNRRQAIIGRKALAGATIERSNSRVLMHKRQANTGHSVKHLTSAVEKKPQKTVTESIAKRLKKRGLSKKAVSRRKAIEEVTISLVC
jgi:hypothetical protein